MKKNLLVCMTLFSLALGGLFVVTPNVALAEHEGGLVACHGADCNFCSLMKTGNNVLAFMFSLLAVFAVIMIVIAGAKLVTSAGNPSAMTAAKSMLTNVLIGFVIVLMAWFIVDTLMKMLVNSNTYGVWNDINCPAPAGPAADYGSGGREQR